MLIRHCHSYREKLIVAVDGNRNSACFLLCVRSLVPISCTSSSMYDQTSALFSKSCIVVIRAQCFTGET